MSHGLFCILYGNDLFCLSSLGKGTIENRVFIDIVKET